MFASLVTQQRCDLFTVMCTDLETWDRYECTWLRSNFKDASLRALEYQFSMDPLRKSLDFRVHQCS